MLRFFGIKKRIYNALYNFQSESRPTQVDPLKLHRGTAGFVEFLENTLVQAKA